MFLKRTSNFYALIVLLVTLIAYTKGSKCGDYICHENTVCQMNKEDQSLYCECEKNFKKVIKEKEVHCQKIEIPNEDDDFGDDEEEELPPDDYFDINDLEIKDPCMVKCSDKCCNLNEICIDGKECIKIHNFDTFNPITNDDDVKIIDPETEDQCKEKCPDKCCNANEICIDGKECIKKDVKEQNDIAKVNFDEDNVETLNPETEDQCEEKCSDKCCKANEICNEGKECIKKDEVVVEKEPTEAEDLIDFLAIDNSDEKTAVKSIDANDLSNRIEKNTTNIINDLSQMTTTPVMQPSDHTDANDYKTTTILNIQESTEITSSEGYASTTFTAVTKNNHCPTDHSICAEKCCTPLEVCNDLDECVTRDILLLYDFPNESKRKPIPKTATQAPETTTFDVDEARPICLNDNHDDVMCVKKAEPVNYSPEIFYTILGSGCLVCSLIFVVLKWLDFRQCCQTAFNVLC